MSNKVRSVFFALLLGWTYAASAVSKPEAIVFIPTGTFENVPVVVWLHAYRSFPSFVNATEYCEALSNQLGIAIIGIPGTTLLPDESPVWSEEPPADHAYIQDYLQRLARRYPLDLSKVALLGFSQGAMVAGDVASRYPESYVGAILYSPTGISQPKTSKEPMEAHKKQFYYLSCGDREEEIVVEWTRLYAGRISALGAHATRIEAPAQSEHTFPADFEISLPDWISKVLQLAPKKK